jgi:hypothetical protein
MSYYKIDGTYVDNDKPTYSFTNINFSGIKTSPPKKIEKFSTSVFNKDASIPSETDKDKLRKIMKKILIKKKEREKKLEAAKTKAEKHASISEITGSFSMEINGDSKIPVANLKKENKVQTSTKTTKKSKTKPTPKPKKKFTPTIIKKPEDPYSLVNLTKHLEKAKLLNFYDKKNKATVITVTKANEICLTKKDRTVCIADNRFSIKADPIRVADIERGDVIIPYRKKPSPPVYIKPKPKPAVPFHDPSKPRSTLMRKYGTVIY